MNKFFTEIEGIKCVIIETIKTHPLNEKHLVVVINMDGEDEKNSILEQVKTYYQHYLSINKEENFTISYRWDDITKYKF